MPLLNATNATLKCHKNWLGGVLCLCTTARLNSSRLVTEKCGFGHNPPLAIAGQTYTRRVDVEIVNALAALGSTAHKMATDIRLLGNDDTVLWTGVLNHTIIC